jgi:hypothetical protein
LWGRAWWGLIVIGLSDGIYSWLLINGSYAMSIQEGNNSLSLVADTMYLVGYLLLGLACLSQYLLVTYGPSLAPRQNVEAVES